MNTTSKENRSISPNFGTMLRYYRENKGLSLQKVQEITGISSSYINRLECGQRRAPSFPILKLLASALEVDMADLIDVALKSDDEPKDISAVILGSEYTIDNETATSDIKQYLMALINLVISHDIDYLDSSQGISAFVEAITSLKYSIDAAGIDELQNEDTK